MYHKLPPLGKLNTEDTLSMSRKTFYLNSHRLDYLGSYLDVGRKLATGGFQLWKDVQFKKDKKALDKMIAYCKEDVRLLGKVYRRISPYVEQTVNKALIVGGDQHLGCKSCGSNHTQKYGKRITRAGKYQKYKCTQCAHIFSDTRMLKEG